MFVLPITTSRRLNSKVSYKFIRAFPLRRSAVRGEGVVQCGHFADKGVPQMRMSHFLAQLRIF